jgi:transposase
VPTDRSEFPFSKKGNTDMLVLGIDAHKRTHTVVAVDEVGRQVGKPRVTTSTTSAANLELVAWARSLGTERRWAVEDCRHVSRRLEADLLAAGEVIVRVPPKLMAGARSSLRAVGKSDPIDALAVARAALREPDLPMARLDGEARQVRLLVDHREGLVAERTRQINRLRWHLHELDPAWDPPSRSLTRRRQLDGIAARLAALDGLVARLAGELVASIQTATTRINGIETELAAMVIEQAPTLLARTGAGVLTVAKIIGEVADIERFKSVHAFARHNGTAPIPIWSATPTRYRLSRHGNRQLNAAIHRIAFTQARCHPSAITYMATRTAAGKSRKEALRGLKRRISDLVYRDLLTDTATRQQHPNPQAA